MPSTSASAPPAPFLSDDHAYEALKSHDLRFDGKLFVGVTSTGIYCRPICRVKLPQQRNCRFFGNAALAEQAGFRPCLRCRPELAPGLALSDSVRSLAHAGAHWMAQQIAHGQPTSVPALAAHLGVSERHVRRIFDEVHGVSPWPGPPPSACCGPNAC
ncbi:Ada metal-binding domain-containing protein [Ideonella paludis]|uniref:Ada metal-binding domain-containing protein n=1 Tax=Ideonella paludis TaxID=1233411 RepID=UPI00363FABB0